MTTLSRVTEADTDLVISRCFARAKGLSHPNPGPVSHRESVEAMSSSMEREGRKVSREPCKRNDCDGTVHWIAIVDDGKRTPDSGDCDGDCQGHYARPPQTVAHTRGTHRLKVAGVPEAISGRLGKAPPWFKQAQWNLERYRLVLLIGPTGTRKTETIAHLLNCANVRGRYVLADQIARLTSQQADRYSLESLCVDRLLAVDSIDARRHLEAKKTDGRSSVRLAKQLGILLGERILREVPTIIGTTVPHLELQRALGPELWRRAERAVVNTKGGGSRG